MKSVIKISVKIILSVLFVLCLLQMPYSYYQAMRFLGMFGFAWLAYVDINKKDKTLCILWTVSALLINPFIKVSLGRTVWNAVDIIWAIILLVTIWTDISLKENNQGNNNL